MSYSKAIVVKHTENVNLSLDAYKKFATFVVKKVQEVGMEKVLQEQWEIGKGGSEYHWLKQAFERVLDYAEKSSVKMIPETIEGTGESGAILLEVTEVRKGEDPEKNYLSTSRFPVPSLQ